jgi:hypothetical protein
LPVQSLEEDEDSFEVLRLHSHAVVAHGKDPFVVTVPGGRYVYQRRLGATVFNRVPDEVLEYLDQLRFVHHDGRQRIMSYQRPTFLDGRV